MSRSAAAQALRAAALFSLIAACAAQPVADPAPGVGAEIDVEQFAAFKYAAPPRTIEDIDALLAQYQPNAALLARQRETAEREPPPDAAAPALAQFYLDRARARSFLGMASASIADLRLAARYAKGTLKGREGTLETGEGSEARILVELSLAELNGGNYVNAMRVREELLRDLRQTQRPRLGTLLTSYAALASFNAALGDIAAAKDNLRRAESLYAKMQRSQFWDELRYGLTAAIERARGAIASTEGRTAAAETALRNALAAMDAGEAGNRRRFKAGQAALPPGRYLAVRNGDELRLAALLVQEGRLAEAEAACRNALGRSLRLFGRYSGVSAGALSALAAAVFEQGRYREAGLLASAAIDVYDKLGVAPESLALARARRAYGAALVAQSRHREAIAVYEAMQAGLARDALLLQTFGAGDVNWGYALVQLGDAGRAVQMLAPMLERARARMGDADYRSAELGGHLAIALAAAGERARALKEFAVAVPVLLEQARLELGSESAGIARTQRLTRILEAYIAALLDARAGAPAPQAIAEAFRLADVARASHVQRALSASAARASIADPRLAELARREQDAQHRLGVLSDLINRLLAAPAEQQLPKVVAEMRASIEQLRAERVALRREIAERFPDYAELTDPKPAGVREAQAALQPGEALISIYVAPGSTYVWALPQRGAVAFARVPLGEAQVNGAVGALRRALDPGNVGVAQMPRFDLDVAAGLYRQLLEAVAPAWRDATSLLIVPHGALAQLPFALLPTGPAPAAKAGGVLFEEYRSVPWLARKAAIAQLPSVNALITLRRVPPAPASRRTFAGFGDPYFSREQAAAARAETAAQVAAVRGVLRNLAIARVDSTRPGLNDPDAEVAPPAPPVPVANSSGLAQLARLPDTADEIREIAQALAADPAQDVFLGAQASERAVKTADLANRRVIAFATHGLLPGDLDGLTQPALALSAPEVVGGDDDGLLTLEEILGLKLNADWVVLSACNTASGEGAGSEAVSGLGRAFFYAGARALLVSNWPVETTSARRLTTELFRRQAQEPGLSRAQALRQTMLSLIDGPGAVDPASGRTLFSYAHPMFWAPFSLVGDGSGR